MISQRYVAFFERIPAPASIFSLMVSTKTQTVGRCAVFLVVTAWICYLALNPNPNAADGVPVFLVPAFRWVDSHDVLRNVLGGMLLQWAFLVGFRNTFYLMRPRFISLWAVPMSALFVGLEVFQRWIPSRTSDIHDMVAGTLGICLVTLIAVNFHRKNHE